VGASPVWIQRPQSNQNDYYSGKCKLLCVKTEALVAADGDYVHMPPVSYGFSQ
jgi:hypothetical protein